MWTVHTVSSSLVRRRRGAIATVIAVALALVFAPAANADENVITLTPSTQTVEYGQGWSITGNMPPYTALCGSCSPGTLVVTSGSTSRTIQNFYVYTEAGTTTQLQFGNYTLTPETDLGVGTHPLSVTYSPYRPDGTPRPVFSSNSVSLTVTPTAITSTTTITSDPNNSSNAIVTSQLGGRFIEQLPSCQCEEQNGYLLPAGTWNLTVTDSHGKTVLSKQADQVAGGLPNFVNFWPSVPTGETFTAQSTFTIAGAAKSNFVQTAPKFSWTSKKGAGEQGSVSPSSKPKPTTVKTASFAPPLVVFWGALLVSLILITLNVLLWVSSRRARGLSRPDRTAVES